MRRSGQHPILPSQITPEALFRQRRRVLAALTAAAGAAWLGSDADVALGQAAAPAAAPGGLRNAGARPRIPPSTRNARFTLPEKPTSFEDVTSYNNFYEFGLEKSDPKEYSQSFRYWPWNVEIAGETELPGRYALEDLLKPHALEERLYRFRCVEAWSMVVPWMGIPLGDLLRRFKPSSKAKFVEFTTLLDPAQMPGQRSRVLDWPYVEGLRIDEAMNPLALLVVGVYGQWLPNQNGAPLRLIVPWKYGFKSIKSIVRIHFTERQPRNSWNISAPEEYGFYANVNPAVDHPRWSQAKERRIGGGLFAARVDTLPFNGYASEVAALYTGMNLARYF